jgi:outer membrane protein assembly factor BamB
MRRLQLLFFAFSITSFAEASNWPKYCSNLAMTGVAESGGAISPATAPSFTQLWSTKLGGPVASSPTVVNDVVYVGDWSGMEWAISALDGHKLAQQNLGTTTSPRCEPATIGITSAAAYSDGAIYLAGGDDSFYSLDAKTLEVKWRQRLGDNSEIGGYYGWCSPAVTGEKVLQGISSNCDDPLIPGKLVSLSRSNGSFLDDVFMVEPNWPQTFNGAGIWTSPSVDVDNGNVFVATGSAFDLHDGHAFSIVRLSLETLFIEDSWKINPPADEDDADWGSSPTLFTDAKGRQLVGAGQKDGGYYAFLRYNLAAGPVWRAPLAKGGACPLCADGTLSTAAFDGKHLYVGSGRPLNSNDALGSVVALDPGTGEVIWQRNLEQPVIAPISYANGVVFTTSGKQAVVLDAGTGEVLWSFQTKAQCVGGVAITDRGIFFGDLSGTLYAFGVPSMPPRKRAIRLGD